MKDTFTLEGAPNTHYIPEIVLLATFITLHLAFPLASSPRQRGFAQGPTRRCLGASLLEGPPSSLPPPYAPPSPPPHPSSQGATPTPTPPPNTNQPTAALRSKHITMIKPSPMDMTPMAKVYLAKNILICVVCFSNLRIDVY